MFISWCIWFIFKFVFIGKMKLFLYLWINISWYIVTLTWNCFHFVHIAVNILDGSIKGHEVSLTLLPANDASGIKEYIVFYKPSKLKYEWKFKRTTQTQVTLRSLKGLTEYTVTIMGYTSSKETYGSQYLKFKTLEGMWNKIK